MKNHMISLSAVAALLLWGCGGAQPEVQLPAEPDPPPTPSAPGADSGRDAKTTGDNAAPAVDGRDGGNRGWTGVRELFVSSAVTAWTKKPIVPAASFPTGTNRIYATFLVRTKSASPYVNVFWLEDGQELASRVLECGGDVRCVDAYEKGAQIPDGDYEIEVQVGGEVMAERSFHVGGSPMSPMLDHIALGVAKGKKAMPTRHSDTFQAKTSGMRCGVRIAALPDEATVKVRWVLAADGGDQEKFVSEEKVQGGGTKTAVLDWPVESDLAPGRYKAVVEIGSRKLAEIEFTVE
jgi:hypothetical protein